MDISQSKFGKSRANSGSIFARVLKANVIYSRWNKSNIMNSYEGIRIRLEIFK